MSRAVVLCFAFFEEANAKVGRVISSKWVVSHRCKTDAILRTAGKLQRRYHREAAIHEPNSMMQKPCSDYKETKGLVYFARMLDKIRLRAEGRLPDDYFTGVEDATFFDARCTRFLGVEYEALAARTLQGGSDEEILEWCFSRGRKPTEEEIEIWNAFLLKRGWRDAASGDLRAAKERNGWGNRDEIQTWVDLHDAEEGRQPRFSQAASS